jgi:probable rRNA maturation factor
MVEIEVANRSAAALDLEAAAQLIRDVLREEGIDEGELGLALVGRDEIRDLKREHLGIDEETDALAFPIDGLETIPAGVPRQLGDVVICPEVVGDAWRGPLIHAVLHLVGYDHGAKMEARERAHA